MIAHSAGAHAHFTARRERGRQLQRRRPQPHQPRPRRAAPCLITRQHYDETKAFPTP